MFPNKSSGLFTLPPKRLPNISTFLCLPITFIQVTLTSHVLQVLFNWIQCSYPGPSQFIRGRAARITFQSHQSDHATHSFTFSPLMASHCIYSTITTCYSGLDSPSLGHCFPSWHHRIAISLLAHHTSVHWPSSWSSLLTCTVIIHADYNVFTQSPYSLFLLVIRVSAYRTTHHTGPLSYRIMLFNSVQACMTICCCPVFLVCCWRFLTCMYIRRAGISFVLCPLSPEDQKNSA